MKTMRAIQVTALGFALSVLCVDVSRGQTDGYTVFLAVSTTLLAMAIGFTYGQRRAFRLMREEVAEPVPFVGGPMDGIRLPPPPGFASTDRMTIALEEYPEGEYHKDGERMVWEES